jgi:hypothetical protein
MENAQVINLNAYLKFGKYKGQQLKNVPNSYRKWLFSQDWYKVPMSKSEKYWVLIEGNKVKFGAFIDEEDRIQNDCTTLEEAEKELNWLQSCYPNKNYEILPYNELRHGLMIEKETVAMGLNNAYVYIDKYLK